MTEGFDSLVEIGHRRAFVPRSGWVPSLIGTCSDLAAQAREHATGAELSRGCGHNRDDETLFSAGPNQPLWCLDWHRAGHCGCGNRLLQRRRCSTSCPQPTGHQRAQGLGEVCAAGLGWWRAKEYQHRMRAKATPLDLGSGQPLISSAPWRAHRHRKKA